MRESAQCRGYDHARPERRKKEYPVIQLPYRQVHLDFHTSEHIPGVGSKFNKKQWQDALKAGAVNSITVFAKCHHSWSYYPTKVGMKHPTLKKDLLGQQIKACHEIRVRAPIYFTVGWSATDAEMHPEWTARDRKGRIIAVNFDPKAKPADPKPGCSWKWMCPSGGYLKLILKQTQEICDRYAVDGFFYDICFGPPCYCKNCRAGMRKAGLDPNRLKNATAYNQRKWISFQKACKEIIHASYPDATIYWNGGAHIYETYPHAEQTHFELEDLPTTWGGYNKFPLRSKYFANKGKQYLAMSGKFHTSWGEFGGFKDSKAILYESAAMISFGARCSFGDQLHPNGLMDMETYRRIGAGFSYVKSVEQYSEGGLPYARLGMWLSGSNDHDHGTTHMLLEKQSDFMVVDPNGDFSRFSTIILPGHPSLDKASAAKLQDFVENGGGLLILGGGALDHARKKFLLNVGARYVGPARYENDYLVTGGELSTGLVTSPFLNYTAGLCAKLTSGEVLARIREPYFDRTYGHYCSHLNTPHKEKNAPHPGAWRKGNIVCLAHELDAMYYQHGAQLHRDLFINALNLIHKDPVLWMAMPSGGRVNLLHQPHRSRYVAHVLYGPPIQRGRCEVIEDLVPLLDIPLTLRVPQKVKNVYTVSDKKLLAATKSSGTVKVTVPRIECHEAVVFEY